MDKRHVYEKINHMNCMPFKIFVASLESSCPHWHEDYEIVLLLKSSISVRFGGEVFKVNAGDILLINSREIHSIFDCEEDNIALFIQFHPDVLKRIMDMKDRDFFFHFNSCSDAVNPKIEYNHFTKMTAELWIKLIDKNPGFQFHLYSKFYQLLGDLFLYTIYDVHYSANNSNKQNDNVSFDKLTGYIEKNYSNDLETEDICRYLGMSRSTLYRFMKSTLGMSLNEFIRYYRIEQAKKLLESTDYSISHISTLCGYLNDMSFYRAFKKETNKTPQDFREKGAQAGTNLKVQGYLSYNNNEAYELAFKFANKY